MNEDEEVKMALVQRDFIAVAEKDDLDSPNEMDDDLVEWLRDNDTESFGQAGMGLQRPDWMIVLLDLFEIIHERWQIVGFAADCAEHVLPIRLALYPDDDRPPAAITAARNGNAAGANAERAWQADRLRWWYSDAAVREERAA